MYFTIFSAHHPIHKQCNSYSWNPHWRSILWLLVRLDIWNKLSRIGVCDVLITPTIVSSAFSIFTILSDAFFLGIGGIFTRYVFASSTWLCLLLPCYQTHLWYFILFSGLKSHREHRDTENIVKNLISSLFYEYLRTLRCLILFTAECAKVAKIRSKSLVFTIITPLCSLCALWPIILTHIHFLMFYRLIINRTRMTRTDGFPRIRANPRHPRNPCSIVRFVSLPITNELLSHLFLSPVNHFMKILRALIDPDPMYLAELSSMP